MASEKTYYRVYATAQTNHAVCELARRTFLSLLDCDNAGLKVERHHLLLVGNKDRLILSPELDTLLFDDRVDRVDKATKLWKATSMGLKDLFHCSLQGESDVPPTKETVLSVISHCIDYSTSIYYECPERLISKLSRAHFSRIIEALNGLYQVVNSSSLEVLATFYHSKDFNQSSIISGKNQSKGGFIELKNISEEVFRLVENQICSMTSISVKGKTMKQLVLENARIIFSTVITAGKKDMQEIMPAFNVVIIDEATQLVEVSTAIMFSEGLQCLVLAGDNKQLPSTVISELAKEKGYGRSLFDRLLQHAIPSSLLNIQYRMHPRISIWPNDSFYNGLLNDGENVLGTEYTKHWHNFLPPFSIYDVHGREEKDHKGSSLNRIEVNVALQVIKELNSIFKIHGKDVDCHLRYFLYFYCYNFQVVIITIKTFVPIFYS
jgi:senataxin